MAFSLSKDEFISYFETTVLRINYKPHSEYNVFTQYDKEDYIENKKNFLLKYKCFAAIGYVLRPKHLIELGTCAGSSAHAYLYFSRNTFYTGYDIFRNIPLKTISKNQNDLIWNSFEIANLILKDLKVNFQLNKINLREVNNLSSADLVVIDADHSYEHAYKDCLLAKTANPEYIFLDDYSGEDVKKAVDNFVKNHIKIEWFYEIDYIGKGILLKISNENLS